MRKHLKRCNLTIKKWVRKRLLGGSVEASQRLVVAPEVFFIYLGERSTPLMSNEGDSEKVVELHSTEPAGVYISLFSDREN